MLLALLLAASPKPMLAVLEFPKHLAPAEQVDAGYFANRVRRAALQAAPGVDLLTRENMVSLLQASGKSLEECEGECEVETGRRLGADYVVSGEIVRLGASLRLALLLHETKGGRLLAGSEARGKSVEELEDATQGAVRELLASLAPRDASMAPRGDVLPLSERIPSAGVPELKLGASQPVTLRISQIVHFDEVSWFLTADAERTLDAVAEVLKAHPGVSVRIEGHAASDEGSVKETSKRRAQEVRGYLIDKGVDGGRLPIQAVGVQSSIAAPGSQAGADGRRVEFAVVQ